MDAMTDEQKAEWRAWNQERWEAVESLKMKELAAMTEETAVKIMGSLRLFAPAPPNPMNGMGLVEQQRIFHRGQHE